MVLLAAGSALVAGIFTENEMAKSPETVQETRRVFVERAFYFNGKPTRVGDTVELPKIFATEMVAAHKARFVAEPPAAEAKQEAKAFEQKQDAKKPEPRKAGEAHAR